MRMGSGMERRHFIGQCTSLYSIILPLNSIFHYPYPPIPFAVAMSSTCA